jgi:hypothetical protein
LDAENDNLKFFPIVERMTWDSMTGKSGDLLKPSWPQVKRRIENLNTPENSMVILFARAGKELTVAGDMAHGFVVYISENDDHKYVLAPPERRKGKEIIVIGFQPGEYARRILVDRETAISVAEAFFRSGQADGRVEWTEDFTVET